MPADLPADASATVPPLVSAIVSTYGAGRFMRSLLEDLEAQTIADQLEIVIVDSCSPENEGEIVREFQQKYNNIVYLRTEQRENTHVALNRCLELARGKYVALANTDDRHVPDAYARMAALLEARPDVALVYADIALTKNEEDITHNRSLQDAEITAYYRWPEFNPFSFFQQCYAGPQPMWRRSLHSQYGGFDPEFAFAGDYEFWLRLIANNQIFLHLPAVLGIMLHTSGSVSHSNKKPLEAEGIRCRMRYWPPQMGQLKPGGPSYLHLPEGYHQDQPERYPTQDRVSVMIRVDKHPELLLESLATVMGQKYPDLELILLNHSRSNLHESLAAVPQLPPTAILEASDLDPVLARNLGLRLSTGRYLFELSSGDRWHGSHLLSHLKALQSHPFVYSDAYRLPYRQTSAYFERIARDLNNTQDLCRGSLLGQFIAPVATSWRTSLLRELPLDPERLLTSTARSRWQTLEALRKAAFFGAQMQRYPDWDLQLLALEQVHPHRLRSITCEYLDEAEPLADGKALLDRIQDSAQALQNPESPPEPAAMALVLLANRLAAQPQQPFAQAAELENLANLVQQGHQLILLSQHQAAVPELPVEQRSRIRSLHLVGIRLLAEWLQKILALTHACDLVLVMDASALPDLTKRQTGYAGLQVLQQDWQTVTPEALATRWPQIRLASAPPEIWQQCLQILIKAGIQA